MLDFSVTQDVHGHIVEDFFFVSRRYIWFAPKT